MYNPLIETLRVAQYANSDLLDAMLFESSKERKGRIARARKARAEAERLLESLWGSAADGQRKEYLMALRNLSVEARDE